MNELLQLAAERNRECEYGTPPSPDSPRPLVSVSVVTYLHASQIRQCLDGILMQETSFPVEVLVGEDESPDETRAICRDYADRYPGRIRLFLRSRSDVMHINGHPTGRFNSLANLLAARGTYIALCEGDDYWTDPRKLQKQIDFMEAHPDCSFSFHAARLVSSDGKTRGQTVRPRRGDGFFRVEDMIRGGGGFFPTSSVVFRREAFFPIPDYYLSAAVGDAPLGLKCATAGRVAYLDERMSVYRKGVPHSWNRQVEADPGMRVHYYASHLALLRAFDEATAGAYAQAVQQKAAMVFEVLTKNVVLDLIRRPEPPPLDLARGIRRAVDRHLPGAAIALFGAGESATDALDLLRQAGQAERVDLVVDNNEERWGGRFQGLPVDSPGRLAGSGRLVLIASMYYDEISIQVGGVPGLAGWCRDLDLYGEAFSDLFPDVLGPGAPGGREAAACERLLRRLADVFPAKPTRPT